MLGIGGTGASPCLRRPQKQPLHRLCGHRVVTGKDGFAALLVFGGPADLGERPATELAKRGGPVYLLDRDGEAYSIAG
ncbi:MAG TPA: hypothetical protein VK932_26200 [Kofleriaceae bacterium]|nr:hypothetical protein [Kofleriaceae bacterium]